MSRISDEIDEAIARAVYEAMGEDGIAPLDEATEAVKACWLDFARAARAAYERAIAAAGMKIVPLEPSVGQVGAVVRSADFLPERVAEILRIGVAAAPHWPD